MVLPALDVQKEDHRCCVIRDAQAADSTRSPPEAGGVTKLVQDRTDVEHGRLALQHRRDYLKVSLEGFNTRLDPLALLHKQEALRTELRRPLVDDGLRLREMGEEIAAVEHI